MVKGMSQKSESGKDKTGGIRAVARTCAILRLVGEDPENGVGLQDIAEAAKIPKSTAHRYIQVLESEGFIARDTQSSNYQIGIELLSLKVNSIERHVQRARPILERVLDQYDETVNIGILVGHQVIYLDIVESPHAVRLAARKGDVDYIHSTAMGKAIAATLDERQVIKILRDFGMPMRTKNTITTVERYLEELKRVKEVGYAVDDRENENDGRCVAVFVPGVSAPVAISVSGIANRFSLERAHEVATSLRIAAMELSGHNLPPIKGF